MATFIIAISWIKTVLYVLIALSGIVGAVLAGTTREDAYVAADRQPKMVWVGILVAASLVVILRFPFLAWIGIVAIGVYWFDVRPQIQDILRGRNRW
ncbi:DUF2516 family protein [Staphylococcus chromogenes]|nr:DUF2516 family protein [Staphylococcus chromogenes]